MPIVAQSDRMKSRLRKWTLFIFLVLGSPLVGVFAWSWVQPITFHYGNSELFFGYSHSYMATFTGCSSAEGTTMCMVEWLPFTGGAYMVAIQN